MEQKIIYAFRGWIAFLAFMDLGTAVRSYIEKRSFLSKTIEDINRFVDEEYTTSRILGMYSILKAVTLIHCTLFIHYKPVLSMGIFSLILTVILYFSETIYFRAANLNFYVVFPFILNVITLGVLLYLLKYLKLWNDVNDDEEDPSMNFGAFRRKRNFKKRAKDN